MSLVIVTFIEGRFFKKQVNEEFLLYLPDYKIGHFDEMVRNSNVEFTSGFQIYAQKIFCRFNRDVFNWGTF